MAHHLFRDIALIERKTNDTFYGDGKEPPIEVPCSKEAKYRMVKTANSKEVQSKMTYLFPIDTAVSPSDIVDGTEVLDVRPNRGMSIAFKEVLT